MMKVKISLLKIVVVVAAVTAVLYSVGSFGPGEGKSNQGRVIRAEVTLDFGSFAVQLTTNSNFDGQRDWVNPGQTYTDRYVQDVLVKPNERVQFWLTAAADIDRSEIAKRTMRCQLYDNGKPLNEPAKDSRPIRRGEAGEPVACTTLVIG